LAQKFLTPILDHYLTVRTLNEKRKTHCFHPSTLSQCPQKLYESYLIDDYSTQQVDPVTSRIFENGHSVHKRLQRNFRDAGLLVDEDVSIHDDKYEICGEIDGLLKYWDELMVFDLKSVNKKKFMTMYKPEDSHVIQVNIYLYCLGLRYGFLFYECKDNQLTHEFLVEYDSDIVLPVFKKIKYVQQCLKDNIVPPCEGGYEGCRWCDQKKK
jgi:hypothetical protein